MSYVLETSLGIKVTAEIDEESGRMSCEWQPAPPFPKWMMIRIEREYIPWRDEILQAWSNRTGKSQLIVTQCQKGNKITEIRPQ